MKKKNFKRFFERVKKIRTKFYRKHYVEVNFVSIRFNK